jgi:hypothetical protein
MERECARKTCFYEARIVHSNDVVVLVAAAAAAAPVQLHFLKFFQLGLPINQRRLCDRR